MLRPSGSALIATTSAPSRRRTSGATPDAAAVRAIDDELHPVEPGLRRGLEVLDAGTARAPSGTSDAAVRADTEGRPVTASASISSSRWSGSFIPSLEKNLMPLSAGGLCEALITTPLEASRSTVMNAIAGVGSTPPGDTSPPAPTDALRERVLEPGTRLAGVPADHERRRLRRAVAAEHGDRRAAEPVGEVARQVGAGHAADAVGAEEPSHQDGTLPEELRHATREREASISSRIGRIASTGRPEGSGRSQSRYRFRGRPGRRRRTPS